MERTLLTRFQYFDNIEKVPKELGKDSAQGKIIRYYDDGMREWYKRRQKSANFD